ncbi:MAG: PQQ-binding-like beta-propeller repeat protein [Emergencia sp.]
MTVDFANHLNNIKSNINGELLIEQPLNVAIKNDDVYKQLDPVSIKISTDVKAYSSAYLNKKSNRTATVKGYVKNASGKAVKGAKVTISTALTDPVTTTTDAKGYYSVKVFGSYNEYYGTWHQAQITVSKKGFAEQSTIIRPKAKNTVTKSFKLVSKSSALTYKKTKEIGIGIQSNYFDVSENSQIIATAPFHSGFSKEKIEQYANLSISNLKGTSTEKIRLYAETACIAVSEDGKYIATQRAGRDDNHSVTVIYDNTGEKIYEREGYPPVGEIFSGGTLMGEDQVYGLYRSAVFSRDNKYMVVSSMNGDVYCLDWKNDKLIWTNNVRNQVRTSEYSSDGSMIYLSSGDGYLYALSASDGDIVWKTYIGSWGTSFTAGEKYIAVSTKSACHSLRILDAKTGKQYWCYDTPGRGEAILSPDEKMVYYCNETSSAYNFATSVVFDTKTGKVLYSVGHGGQMGAWSKNGKYLVVKTNQELYVCKASTGEILWKKKCSDCFECGSRALAVSNDGKYIAAGFNSERGIGKILFYQKS